MKVDLGKLCAGYGIRAVPYRTAWQLICDCGLEQLANDTAGFCFFLDDQYIILYDSSRPILEVRFTVAHELGHIVLGHLSFRSGVLEKLHDSAEQEADAFAARLLADELRLTRC